ncbi:hypothetical protein [Alteromonas oceanisediminis]|uniref:hypothetical protein n=1 Tax=Alteromonas oceanisediminis TaxID=2836180 RepID=UPI001BDB5CA7|nr:hypothetical protein [Alteromonas oceanisediminis]MBT0587603.1 hypothetical protein [Alteromonas oceanisediminis]
MPFFSDIGSKFTDWLGVPGILAAFAISLCVWLYYDLIIDSTLNSTMMLGVSICSIFLVAVAKMSIKSLKRLVNDDSGKPNA